MINNIIAFSVKNKFIIGLMTLAWIAAGIWSITKVPLDAVPDITNNQVQISKDNLDGLVNAGAGAYDTNEFQANIPYSVTASWNGVALNAQTTGTPQFVTVATNQNANSLQQGAWRSDMQIDIVAPRVNGKGLVAGNYEGTTTLTLRAL